MSYRDLFDSNPLPIWVIAREGFRFLRTNSAASALFGYSAKEFASMSLADLQTPAEFACFQEAIERNDYRATESCGWRGRNKNGDALDLELHIAPVLNDASALILIPTENRERRSLEEQLRQAQKMEAVGMLAGGIAHDFNNLLTIISGYTQMLLAGQTMDERDRSSLEQILKAGDRAADLTRQLLNFSRRQNIQPKVLDLNAIVSGMTKMVNRVIGEHIDLRVDTGEDVGRIRIDPGKAEQVILNLVVNARDALPQGGKLSLSTRSEEVNEERAAELRVRPGRYSVLSVNDTGSGIDAATQERVFEPFFTTKSHGTGLGLSTVFGIVKQANGSIRLWSEPGVGTSVDVYIPRVADDVVAETLAAEPIAAGQGRENILIVEDEEAVRRMVRAALERNGYRVLVAAGGMEALKLIASHAGSVDLMITDLVMPGMSGVELARKVKERLPGIGVLYISGYAEESHAFGEIDENNFLQKPFAPQQLSRRVREMLDHRVTPEETHRSNA